MLKFIHLICGTTFFGIIVAAFFYITNSIRKSDTALIHYSLKTSYFGDGVVFLMMLVQLITATNLVSAGHLTLKVPWIFIAYHALGTIILLWLGILLIKLFYLSKPRIALTALNLFNLFNIMIILIFIIIVHDAVNHNTWFDFLLRK